MIPFSRFAYRDTIRIQRVRWEEVQGDQVARYDTALEPFVKASVQSKTVTRLDPEGRTTIVTIHTVRTPTNQEIKEQDHLIWTDLNGYSRTLTAEGASTPKGIGDVMYLTECVEII